MAFLELHDIRKSYYIGKTAFPVLKGINLSFEKGEFVSILGESGGGKSTLMNILGCLDRPVMGHYYLDGIDISALNQDLGPHASQKVRRLSP